MDLVLGIDPGCNGAAAIMQIDGRIVHTIEFAKGTELDICNDIVEFSADIRLAYLEKVHSMPKQGVSSTFKFGSSFGFIRGVITALKIPYELITPQQWQKAMGCQTKGNKNITKAAAQRLFPQEKITHARADSILIAEFCRCKYVSTKIKP